MPMMPPTFRPAGQRTRREANQAHDRRRGNERERGYDSRWRASAKAYRSQHPLCLGCQAIDRISATEVVDHIVPHQGDQALFWDPSNWQPACRPHHDVVKQRLELMLKQGKATRADLKLDSSLARQLSIELRL